MKNRGRHDEGGWWSQLGPICVLWSLWDQGLERREALWQGAPNVLDMVTVTAFWGPAWHLACLPRYTVDAFGSRKVFFSSSRTKALGIELAGMPRFAKASAKAAVVPVAGPEPRSIADCVSQDPPPITAVDVIGRVCYVFGSQGRYPQCKFALRAASTSSGTAGTSGETWPIAILVKCNGPPGRMPALDDMVTLRSVEIRDAWIRPGHHTPAESSVIPELCNKELAASFPAGKRKRGGLEHLGCAGGGILVCCYWNLEGLVAVISQGFRAGKRQTWTPIRSHWCVAPGCLLAGLEGFKRLERLEGFKGLEGFRAGKRQTWTPIRSHWCVALGCLLAARALANGRLGCP